ncbi:hypothetical protein D3C87_1419420 [compost metagenome]
MEFFASIRDKVELKPNHVILNCVTYKEATLAAKLLDWAQFHVIKPSGDKVVASFVVTKEESLRVWKLLKGDDPEPHAA